jgi:hypothetical protein
LLVLQGRLAPVMHSPGGRFTSLHSTFLASQCPRSERHTPTPNGMEGGTGPALSTEQVFDAHKVAHRLPFLILRTCTALTW